MIAESSEWKALEQHAKTEHFDLKILLNDPIRCANMLKSVPFANGKQTVHVDFSRELINTDTMGLLSELAQRAELKEKISAMFRGEHINETENRAVLHVALRAADPKPEVKHVLDKIEQFSEKVRCGEFLGSTGKKLTDCVCIGIGGSYLGPEFVFEALRTTCLNEAAGRKMRFLANVDPIDIRRSLDGLDPQTTLVIVISKTFTTAETMLNAKTVKQWLVDRLGEGAVPQHMVAVSTALDKTKSFGISDANVFGFWEWVGGRFSVCSAVGILPLAIHFGFDICKQFLSGANAMDDHFETMELWDNLPVLMGLIAVWNSSFLGFGSLAVLPYCQALTRFVAHIQQVDMESNGKQVSLKGEAFPFNTAPVTFGEPGTNGQHSFYQLLHQGTRIIPAEFLGFIKSPCDISLPGEMVSNHDELMSNFFAQPDALALGSRDSVHPFKNFPGNRPSLSILMEKCDPFNVGLLLALYEHKTAVMSFLWGSNAFDQWGVELGKVLAKEVRNFLATGRNLSKFILPTQKLLSIYKADD